MIVFAVLMAVRGLRRGGLRAAGAPGDGVAPAAYGRLGIVLAFCIGFIALLLGRMPFWVAAWLFVTISIGVLRCRELKAQGRLARGLAHALVIGLCAGAAVTLVFERIFLVRLP
jgi:hypothetical protein